KRYKKELPDIMNSVDTGVPENTFSSQEHNSILTDAEADKFDSEADKINGEIVKKPEVHEEADEVIDEEAKIETLTDELTCPNYNHIENARFRHQTKERLLDIAHQQEKVNKEWLATEYGLTISPGPFNSLMWDQHIQIPQDIYHSMGGKARTLLDATFNILNTIGEDSFLKSWKAIEKPLTGAECLTR
ncbi:21754_t:CDS:2, partial [Cetraspora pellucida]